MFKISKKGSVGQTNMAYLLNLIYCTILVNYLGYACMSNKKGKEMSNLPTDNVFLDTLNYIKISCLKH